MMMLKIMMHCDNDVEEGDDVGDHSDDDADFCIPYGDDDDGDDGVDGDDGGGGGCGGVCVVVFFFIQKGRRRGAIYCR